MRKFPCCALGFLHFTALCPIVCTPNGIQKHPLHVRWGGGIKAGPKREKKKGLLTKKQKLKISRQGKHKPMDSDMTKLNHNNNSDYGYASKSDESKGLAPTDGDDQGQGRQRDIGESHGGGARERHFEIKQETRHDTAKMNKYWAVSLALCFHRK